MYVFTAIHMIDAVTATTFTRRRTIHHFAMQDSQFRAGMPWYKIGAGRFRPAE